MSETKKHNRILTILLVMMIFVLACSINTAPTNSNPPAVDGTKIALEFQATQISLQQTQAALSNAQAQPPPVQATEPPAVQAPAATEAPAAEAPDYEALIKNAKILVYENTDERNIGLFVKEALDNLGLKYTHTGSYSGHFMQNLNSGTIYDLVIVDAEDKDIISGEFWDVINTRLNRDKAALIVEVWYLNTEANGPINKIMSKCGIAYRKDIDFDDSIYWWDPTNPIFNQPNTVLPLLNFSRFWNGGNGEAGDQIRLTGNGDATMLAGLTASSGQEGVMAVCMQGRVIFQTFSDHDYHEGDIVPLWENYIYNTLKAHFEAIQ